MGVTVENCINGGLQHKTEPTGQIGASQKTMSEGKDGETQLSTSSIDHSTEARERESSVGRAVAVHEANPCSIS